MVEKKKSETAAAPSATESSRSHGDALRGTGEASLVKQWTTQKPRVSVAKAYKMFVGGAFVRSESGRYFQVQGTKENEPGVVDVDPDPEVVNVPRGSRKDVRDAVLAAKNALGGWEKRTAFNRGQILYRLAEVMESRRAELVQSLVRSGSPEVAAVAEVEASIDRAVFYAGFADKYFALLASHNPVAGPHFDFSIPESMGVIGVVAPDHVMTPAPVVDYIIAKG